jgi:hypothetical protein
LGEKAEPCANDDPAPGGTKQHGGPDQQALSEIEDDERKAGIDDEKHAAT